MRTTRLLLLVGVAVLILLPSIGWTQNPQPQSGGGQGPGGMFGGRGFGGPGGMGGGRGFGGGGFDPNQMFDMMSKGKDVVKRADLDPMTGMRFDRIAAGLGITNGQLTRQQYLDYMQQRMAGRGGPPGAGGPAAPGAPAPASPNFGGGGGGPRGMGGGEDRSANWAESMFRRLDLNGDGLLNNDEMPESLRIERDKWDTNKDGFIDLNEYKAYFQARMQQMQAERAAAGGSWGGGNDGQAEEEERKQVVYRAGKLPKELPAWFAQLDTDGDGQIGVYEWKNSGRSMREFEAMDRNGDGFLTIDEVLRSVGVTPGGGENGLAGGPSGGGFGGNGWGGFGGSGMGGGMGGSPDGRRSFMMGPPGGNGGFGKGMGGPGMGGGPRGGGPRGGGPGGDGRKGGPPGGGKGKGGNRGGYGE
jgi:Ca2+-binding EF-hand superfamily protein